MTAMYAPMTPVIPHQAACTPTIPLPVMTAMPVHQPIRAVVAFALADQHQTVMTAICAPPTAAIHRQVAPMYRWSVPLVSRGTRRDDRDRLLPLPSASQAK